MKSLSALIFASTLLFCSSHTYSSDFFVKARYATDPVTGEKIYGDMVFNTFLLVNAGLIVSESDAPDLSIFDFGNSEGYELLSPSSSNNCSLSSVGGVVQIGTSNHNSFSLNFSGPREECLLTKNHLRSNEIRILFHNVPMREGQHSTSAEEVELHIVDTIE